MKDPLISIITVSFNSEKTIRDTLQSVMLQDKNLFEYIIIDGGSSDRTIEIINEFDFIDVLISEKDKGIYDGMNKGIHLAKGKFIGFLNSDDLFANKDVLRDIDKALSNQNTDIIFGDIRYFKDNIKDITRIWVSGEYKKGSFNHGWHPPHPAFYAKRDMFEKFGGFNLDLKIAADFELMLRFFLKTTKKPIYINSDFVLMREGGASQINRFQGNKDVLKAFELNNIKVNKFYYLFRRLFLKSINNYFIYPLKKLLNQEL